MSLLPVVQNQYGQLARRAQDDAQRAMDIAWGPIPAYLIDELPDEDLAMEIKRRWVAKRIEQGPRNLLDMRMLAFLSPEKVQDQWQSVWTGKPMKKLRHSTDAGMSIGVYNQIDPIVQSLLGVLAGNEPAAFEITARPRDMNSEAAAFHAEINEEFLYLWRQDAKYDRTFMDGVGNMIEIGRNWRTYTTDPKTRRTVAENVWPGHVAGYWQSDMRTLEQVIVARYLTLGEAMRMYPDKKEDILNALRPASTRTFGANPLTDEGGWMRYATACLLTLWYRGMNGNIGMAVTLLSAAAPNTPVDQMIVAKNTDTGYSDVPAICTPLFKVGNRPPDESQGIIFKIAGVQTEFNEIVSATHDMLYRDFYPTWFAKGFTFRSGPRRIGRSAMLALPRADQAIGRIQDAIQSQGAEHFAVRLEEQMYLLGITNRMFLGTAPTGALSSDAIDANINSLMARVSPIRKNIKADETAAAYQVIEQQIAFGEYELPEGGGKVAASLILDRAHELEFVWTDTFQSVKKKQLALSGLGKVHGLDTAQREWGIARRASERRRMAKEHTDEILFPQFVSQTAAAIVQKVNANRELSIAATLASGQPLPKAPVTRVTLSGLLSPAEVQAAAELAGIKGEGPTPQDMAGTTRALPIPANSAEAPMVRSGGAAGAAAAIAARAAAASSAAAAPSVPKFESDNAPSGPPASTGDMSNPTNANPATGSRPG